MKVFELMAELAKLPAGAEVEFTKSMTVEDLIKNDTDITDDNKTLYFLSKPIAEVALSASGTVYLYSD